MAVTGSIIAGTFATSAAAIAGTSVVSAFAGSIVGQLLISTVLGAALQALAPKPSSGVNRGYQTNTLGSASDRAVIYGKSRQGGVIVFDEVTGNSNKFLHRVVAMAGHEIESFDEIYIDDEVATIDGSGNVTSPSRYNGKVRINFHLGDPDQLADADLVAESDQWTSEYRLRGVAYIYVRMTFDADVFPNGIPTFTSTIKGKKLYDPRTDTTAWSDNPALCIRDYLTNTSYGLGELEVSIDDAYVIASANICDQTDTLSGSTRYTMNGGFTTSVTPYDLLNSALTSMGGSMWYGQGKWRMKAAYWTAPVMDINEDDLRSSISVATRHSRRDNFNAIKGTFRGEESNWQVTDYPEVTNAAFLAADNGQESVADVDLGFTDTSVGARRLALISLERNRQQLTVNASFGLRTLELQVGDNIRLTNSRFGWVNKEFEVVQWNFGLVDGFDLQISMVLRETAESVFDEVSDGVVYERDNTNLLSLFDVPSVGLSAIARTQVIREKLTNIISLTVSSSASERIDYVEAEFKLSSDSVFISLGTGQLGEFKAVDLEDGDYDFRARAINTFGIKGVFEYLNSFNASGLLAPPSDVQNLAAEVNGSVITLDWDAIPDLDLSFYRIRYSPNLLNATWANSITYVDKVPRPASSISVPARAGTYLVRSYDKSGISSIGYKSVVVPIADIEPLANTISLADSPAFTGAKTNTEVVNNTLRLTSFATGPSSGEYAFSDYIETLDGSVKRSRVYVSAVNTRFDSTAGLFDDQTGNFDDGAGNFDELGSNSQFDDTDLISFVSTTQDDPAGTPTWSAYSPVKVADISARAFRFKVLISSSSNNITPSISELIAYVEYN